MKLIIVKINVALWVYWEVWSSSIIMSLLILASLLSEKDAANWGLVKLELS